MSQRNFVFLSYGREKEVTDFVCRLTADLERHDIDVWLDQKNIAAGSDWHEAIGNGLHNCLALIAVITRKYVESRFCKSELYTADADGKAIFPVFYEDIDLSTSERARGVKYVVSGINWTMFRPHVDEYNQSLQKLIEGLKAQGLAGDSSDSAVAAPDTKEQTPPPYSSLYPVEENEKQWSRDTTEHQASVPSAPPMDKEMMSTTSSVGTSSSCSSDFSDTEESDSSGSTEKFSKLSLSSFEIGVHLEARDRKHPSMVCVAAISRIQDGHLLIHFDGWTEKYDYWCEPSSQDIHPVGWCEKYGYKLESPKNWVGEFSWGDYLRKIGGSAAPENLFTLEQRSIGPPCPVRSSSHFSSRCFEPGMRLEAKDRQHPTLVCAATITEIRDNRLRIHFDGWSDKFDYWCESTSLDIHPVGWCKKHKHKLQPPPSISLEAFDWGQYLKSQQAVAAPKRLFSKKQRSFLGASPAKSSHPFYSSFRPGMRLEALDRKHPTLVCVATVAEVDAHRLRIHFDGWSNDYDYWCDQTSLDIHPIGWCKKSNVTLRRPPDGSFTNWQDYLKSKNLVAAPESLFHPSQCVQPQGGVFREGMKLEARDERNPGLVCVATIATIDGSRVRVHFDGWSEKYDYWCESTSASLHPVGWCDERGRKLQAPRGNETKQRLQLERLLENAGRRRRS
ncbi:MBT domain-containing protein 1-like isoform X2 [Oscarella lobularis]|uniref:MBT domain-containing protein 1-like isoform X2 n=1 Tax=Oscarella lobularis TaxID=121494 RepID=UPI00331331AC